MRHYLHGDVLNLRAVALFEVVFDTTLDFVYSGVCSVTEHESVVGEVLCRRRSAVGMPKRVSQRNTYGQCHAAIWRQEALLALENFRRANAVYGQSGLSAIRSEKARERLGGGGIVSLTHEPGGNTSVSMIQTDC